MQQAPTSPLGADLSGLTARLASARLTDDQARQIIASPEAHRAFIASLCAGMSRAAGKRS
ncbi:hypothetical protein [Brevundimonas variabilis]|uniref:Uncharacterized protein n=1 Tax=Brevundimonas variabilis TaxID=74312 RepID=A0A7W9CJD8_9CAUL|nr:hypothetical protein [Brevundimonas variabilis]MBB5746692.1 hypothetical protein [Brevundimonas variabilis]